MRQAVGLGRASQPQVTGWMACVHPSGAPNTWPGPRNSPPPCFPCAAVYAHAVYVGNLPWETKVRGSSTPSPCLNCGWRRRGRARHVQVALPPLTLLL
jgi:hypothetical protein